MRSDALACRQRKGPGSGLSGSADHLSRLEGGGEASPGPQHQPARLQTRLTVPLPFPLPGRASSSRIQSPLAWEVCGVNPSTPPWAQTAKAPRGVGEEVPLLETPFLPKGISVKLVLHAASQRGAAKHVCSGDPAGLAAHSPGTA